jgi:hypothetical protein
MTFQTNPCSLVVLVACAAYSVARAAVPTSGHDAGMALNTNIHGLASGSLSATTRLPRFPAKPAGINPAEWTALRNAVVQTLPASTELIGDAGENGSFGNSVALSGTTALVGAYTGYKSNSEQGKAYVFTFNGSTWSKQQELIASDGAESDEFGVSVALSGTTALVGAVNKTIGSNSSQGAAYVFTFNGSTWTQQQELTASDGAKNDSFGYSVALSGTTALVGAVNREVGSNAVQGAAYVFTFNGSTWSQQQELTSSDGVELDSFGWSAALSGTTALVGAYNKTIGSNSKQGAAYVFTFNGSTWSQQQELTASDGHVGDYFGWSVALSDTTALVGAHGRNNYQGLAYVFTFNGTSWSQQQELVASDGATNDRFGFSVALSDTTALVGAYSKTIGANSFQGAAYVFADSGGQWLQQQELTASDGTADDEFGYSVALSGATALVGAEGKFIASNSSQGAAYVFSPVSDTIFCDGFDGAGMCK